MGQMDSALDNIPPVMGLDMVYLTTPHVHVSTHQLQMASHQPESQSLIQDIGLAASL